MHDQARKWIMKIIHRSVLQTCILSTIYLYFQIKNKLFVPIYDLIIKVKFLKIFTILVSKLKILYEINFAVRQ